MGSEWTEVTLGEVIHVKHGYAFKSKLYSQEKRGRPVVVGIGNFKYTGGFRFESTKRNEYTADYPAEFVLLPGEILLVMTCQTSGGEILGIPGRIPDDGSIYLHNQRLGKVVVKQAERSCEDFLYWLFLSRPFNQHLYLTATGTKILHTAPKRIEAFKCPLPPLPEQKRIAGVLGALDDKIELNRKMNQTLEEMAQALFKSWFIDFDGHDPADLVDSELGPIPRGWGVGNISTLGNIITGKTPSKKEVENFGDKYPFIKIPDMHNQIWTSKVSTSLSEIGHSKQSKKLLPANAICVSCIATPGLVCITRYPSHTNSIVLNEENTFFWAFHALRGLKRIIIARASGGSVTKNLNKGHFSKLKLVIPPVEFRRKYHHAVSSWLKTVCRNTDNSVTLAQLRDTLLPKLISGEIRVPEAERAVEVVV